MATSRDDCTSLGGGDIRFYDNYVPTLGVGDYLINVTQRLNPTTDPPIDECWAAAQAFSVQGPRYTLPAGDVFSVFPPNNSQGIYDQFLPHVVLAQRELPWERKLFEGENPATQTPWMALLLFVEGEQIGGQDALLAPQVPSWSANRTMSATIPAASFFADHTGDGILWPCLEREWYEDDDFLNSSLTSVIDLSPAAFRALIPSPADLRYLAHARQVNPSAKDTDVLKVAGDGWYSVLVANRLPDPPAAGAQDTTGQPGRRNIVHLVSLEGLGQYLNGAALPAGTQRIRLISFQSWSFTCLPELGESFRQIMNGLLTDDQQNPKPTAYTLPVPEPGNEDPNANYAYQAIQRGYVPLRYQTRPGETTFAWYRGPFSPVPVKDFVTPLQQGSDDPAGWSPFGTASAAMIYDKVYGVFDASYGVAWEAGRLLALADGNFGQQLLDFQQKGHALIDLILERKTQIAALASFNPTNPDAATERSLLQLLQPYAITGDFMSYLVTQFAAQVAPKLYEPAPVPTDQPFPAYPDLPPPPSNPQTIADLLAEPDVQEAIRALGGQELDAIIDWLARLFLLTKVPFESLVPAGSLLPPESVRFFYLDPNWLYALLEGALSIGVESSLDRVYQDLMKDLIWDAVVTAMQQVRDNLLASLAKVEPSGATLPYDQLSLTGVLLRSSVVAGWPGLQLYAYGQTKPGSAEPDISTAIPLLRLERLSDDIMLCIWPTVPAVVTIDEPHEGVAFGFEDPPAGEGDYLYLRSLDPATYGQSLGTDQAIDANGGYLNASRQLVLAGPNGLLAAIQAKLPGTPTLNVRDFAVQMIKTPERAVFAAQALAPQTLQPAGQA
jgi:hypothetical protein